MTPPRSLNKPVAVPKILHKLTQKGNDEFLHCIMNEDIFAPTVYFGSLYYEVKLVPQGKGVPRDFMIGQLIVDAKSANLTIRQFLWEALKHRSDRVQRESDSPAVRKYKHWCQLLYNCKPLYYKHFFIRYNPNQKEAAETVFRCLSWLEENDPNYYMSVLAKA